MAAPIVVCPATSSRSAGLINADCFLGRTVLLRLILDQARAQAESALAPTKTPAGEGRRQTPEPFFRINDQRVPRSSHPHRSLARELARRYHRVRHKHCCYAPARLIPRGPSFGYGVQRQTPLALSMQQLAE